MLYFSPENKKAIHVVQILSSFYLTTMTHLIGSAMYGSIAANLALEPELKAEKDRQGDQDEHCSRIEHKPKKIAEPGEAPGEQGDKSADDQTAAAAGALLLILISHSGLM